MSNINRDHCNNSTVNEQVCFNIYFWKFDCSKEDKLLLTLLNNNCYYYYWYQLYYSNRVDPASIFKIGYLRIYHYMSAYRVFPHYVKVAMLVFQFKRILILLFMPFVEEWLGNDCKCSIVQIISRACLLKKLPVHTITHANNAALTIIIDVIWRQSH